jgi:hypothetical protein
MSAHTAAPTLRPTAAAPPVAAAAASPEAMAGRHAFWLLRIAFTVAPIAFGVDKFFNVLVDWPQYLAGWMNDVLPGDGHDAMHLVGVVEICAGLLVAYRPRLGAPLVAAWLAGIILDLLTLPGFYDVALHDFGLMLGALTLARLAWTFDPPRARR